MCFAHLFVACRRAVELCSSANVYESFFIKQSNLSFLKLTVANTKITAALLPVSLQVGVTTFLLFTNLLTNDNRKKFARMLSFLSVFYFVV